MTAVLRSLTYRAHETEPGDAAAHVRWWVEQIITWAYDFDEPRILDCLAWVRPDLTPAQIKERVEQLLDLADEIDSSATRTPRWHAAVDEHYAALCDLAGQA